MPSAWRRPTRTCNSTSPILRPTRSARSSPGSSRLRSTTWAASARWPSPGANPRSPAPSPGSPSPSHPGRRARAPAARAADPRAAGFELRDLRGTPALPAGRVDPHRPFVALRRGQGVCPQPGRPVPGARPLRSELHPLQPRVAKAPRDVRDAQDHGVGSADRGWAAGRPRARQPRCRPGLGLGTGLRGRNGPHDPPRARARPRDRDRNRAHDPGLRHRRRSPPPASPTGSVTSS